MAKQKLTLLEKELVAEQRKMITQGVQVLKREGHKDTNVKNIFTNSEYQRTFKKFLNDNKGEKGTYRYSTATLLIEKIANNGG